MDPVRDRLDIIDIGATYSAAASRCDGKGIAGVFAANAKLAGVARLVGQGDKDIEGAETIGAFFAAIFETLQFVHQMSQVSNIVITGDKATATTAIIEYARPKDGGKLMLVMGDYSDEFARTPMGWRYAKRTLNTKVFTFLTELPM